MTAKSVTIEDVRRALEGAGKPASESTIHRYFRACGVKREGARQIPQRYEGSAIDKVLNHLGLGSPFESTRPALGIGPVNGTRRTKEKVKNYGNNA